MNNTLYSILGILVPFIGTTFGSSLVYFIKDKLNLKIQKFIIGFSAGVMIAASIWSLIIPSLNMVEKYKWIPASFGFILGIIFLIWIKKLACKFSIDHSRGNLNMLAFSVTLHNIPEGMAVGVCFAGVLSGNAKVALIEALILALGIAIQNIPEGAIISFPLKMKGKSKTKAFICGMSSGIVEPLFAFITIIFLNIVVPLLPYLLSFAAGAMIYVVVEELIPEMHVEKSDSIGILGLSFGFLLMMILDVTLV